MGRFATLSLTMWAMGLLAPVASGNTYIVSSLSGGTGVGTLRWAVNEATNTPGVSHTIDLTGLTGTLVLNTSPPVINTFVTVKGPGADKLTIRSDFGVRVFQSSAGVDLVIEDLKLKAEGITNVGDGGAVSALGDLTMRRCLVEGYQAQNGGAVYCGGTLILGRCVFVGNTAVSDGGAVATAGIGTVSNCTFGHNKAAGKGGAFSVQSNDIVLIDSSTFNGNSAGTGGGGVDSTGSLTQVSRSIVAGNTVRGEDTVDGQLGTSVLTAEENLIGGNPLLYPLRYYEDPLPYFLPRWDSLAIEGSNNSDAGSDARGNSRPFGTYRDLGAIEVRSIQVTDAPGLSNAIQTSNQAGDRTDFIAINAGNPDGSEVRLIPNTALPSMTRGSIIVGYPGVSISGFTSFRILTIASGAVGGFDKVALKFGNAGTSGRGGAILVEGRCYLQECHLVSNQAGCGGAVFVDSNGQLFTEGCFFESNQSNPGDSGALEVRGEADLRNTTFFGNMAINRGGGMGLFSGKVNAIHCTFNDNDCLAVGGGGAIHSVNAQGALRNCFFSQNIDGAITTSHVVSTGGLSEFSSIKTTPSTLTYRTRTGCTPILEPDVDSPARDSADYADMLPYDARGAGRPGNGLPDAGAVERYDNGYDEWVSRYFSPAERCLSYGESSLWGPRADPNKDGFTNMEACALLLPPRDYRAFMSVSGATPPLHFQDTVGNDEYSHLFYFVNREVLGNPLTIAPKQSLDLAVWSDALIVSTAEVTPKVFAVTSRAREAISARPTQFLGVEIGGMPLMSPLFVGVSSPGNANSGDGIGAVAYHYSIMKYEVTNREWVTFLNAVDPSGGNTLGLWHTNQGITRSLSQPMGKRYTDNFFTAYFPASFVDFYDACRYCNWLHNGAKVGADTESGAYLLTGGTRVPGNAASIVRDANARFAVPTRHEWYKAGHFRQNGSYSTYPNGQDNGNNNTIPGNVESMNYGSTGPLLVGAYPFARSPWRAVDMGGNLAEWSESSQTGDRLTYGGSWSDSLPETKDPGGNAVSPTTESLWIGLRVVKLRP